MRTHPCLRCGDPVPDAGDHCTTCRSLTRRALRAFRDYLRATLQLERRTRPAVDDDPPS